MNRGFRGFSQLLFAAALIASFSGCGSGEAAAAGGGQSVRVDLAPPSAQVQTGASARFAATVTGVADQNVVWSVTESGGGSVDAGVYHAPQTAGTYHVVARSVADPTVAGTAVVTVTTSPPATTMSGLHVSGNKILNGAGQTVRLLGANYSQAEFACLMDGVSFYSAPNQALVNLWKTWGFTVIRIPLDENCWLGTNGLPKSPLTASQYKADVVAAVNIITSNGLAAIVDLHRNWPGTGAPGNTQTCGPDADHSPAFWTDAANTFKNNSSVVFDLFNEPCQSSWSCWANGGSNCGDSFTMVGMNQLVSAVRAAGATNILMLGGIQYAHDISQWAANKPADATAPAGYQGTWSPQLMAAFHMYGNEVAQNSNLSNYFQSSGPVATLAASYPVLLGEFGGSYDAGTNENQGCDTSYPISFMKFMNGLGQHYTAWDWYFQGISGNCNNGDFPLTTDGNTGTPTPWGTALKQGIAGTL